MPSSSTLPDIALVIIAKDEQRCIARCIDSARSFVSRVVVLDTGSTDRTAEIAASCGAQVHHFRWCDDFSAARNRALELADADWSLVLDADEWLSAGGGWLPCLGQMGHVLGTVEIHSVFESERITQVSQSSITRLLPRGVRYQGVVHEQPCSDLQRVATPLVVLHDGYLPDQMQRKRGRNRQLLLQELDRNPESSYVRYQLGVDAELDGRHADACDYFAGALAGLCGNAGYEHDLCIRYLYCLDKAGLYEEGMEFAQAQMEKWPDSPDFFFALGGLMLDVAIDRSPRESGHWLAMAEAAWQRCLEIGEVVPSRHGSVAGRGSYLAAHNLAVMYEQLGQLEKAQALRRNYPMPA
ncbi:SPBc2 prophage-derived glycosyltransferase SunS [Delftia tsuruhatensis]|uniref:glycosyltransferase family 2 protein n=1 Tax=Delftia tsuruhatensis TaxID=180282 RepID=UPI001E7C321B|nr:glycosyltransferase family 2 protein [Delftia tsuruhatensis]CAB5698973.1 SPBc2 prophage-derived glycosyltransferase SunS [Delftia tsuruhatensis]CAC9676508.1 SPBc2 prophage-derived glycosyltransferase SunS [Delftia tsuruhatensis]